MWRATLPFLWRALRTHRLALVVIAAGSFALGSIATLKSLIESRVLDRVVSGMGRGDLEQLLSRPLGAFDSADRDWVSSLAGWLLPSLSLGGGVVVYLSIGLISIFLGILTASLRGSVERTLYSALYQTAVDTSLQGQDRAESQEEPGGAAGAIHSGSASVAAAYAFLVEAGQYIFSLATIILLLSGISIYFALFCFGLTVLLASLSWIQGRHLARQREQYDAQRRELYSATNDVLKNRDVLLAHERASQYVSRLRASSQGLATTDRVISVREQYYAGAVQFIQDVGTLGILTIALLAATGGADVGRVGDTYFYVSLFARLMIPIRGLLSGYDDVRDSMSRSRTLVELLGIANVSSRRVGHGEDSSSPHRSQVAVQFKDVSFSYASGHTVLRKCIFSVPRGGVTLIIGPSGAGKTTVARLMLGFLKPDSGSVEIFARSTAHWNPESLLGQMSYLSQTGHVLAGSVRENLFASAGSTREALQRAVVDSGLASILREPSGGHGSGVSTLRVA